MTRQSRTKRLMAGVSAAMLALGLAAAGSSALAQSAPPNNVQATAAALSAPAQIAYDAAGNLYIADLNNQVIRKVDLAGMVTTVAGTGEQGFAGDGGPATSAQLDSPAGVAVNAAGDIYIADTHNQRIRKVSGGTITTIAGTGVAGFSGDGGAAASAQLSNPTALALDSNGNLFIADTDNHRIRKISGATITTVAGNGEQAFSGDGASATAAGIDSPNGVAVDAAGKIYIGDTHNQRVRVVDTAGVISTLAGNGSKSYGGDGGAAAGASLARPRGLSVDAQGNIYIADSDNNRIRVVGTTGKISTVAGNGSQGFAGDGGLAVNATLDTPRAPAAQAPGVFAFSNNQLVRGVDADGMIYTIGGQNSDTGSGQSFSETLILSGASTVAFGSGSLTATFSNAGQTATGQVSLLDITGSSTSVGAATLTNNVATISTGALLPGIASPRGQLWRRHTESADHEQRLCAHGDSASDKRFHSYRERGGNPVRESRTDGDLQLHIAAAGRRPECSDYADRFGLAGRSDGGLYSRGHPLRFYCCVLQCGDQNCDIQCRNRSANIAPTGPSASHQRSSLPAPTDAKQACPRKICSDAEHAAGRVLSSHHGRCDSRLSWLRQWRLLPAEDAELHDYRFSHGHQPS